MQRTNIYLDPRQLDVLRRLGTRRAVPVSVLIRQAVDVWLEAQGAQVIGQTAWQRRFNALLARRRRKVVELQPSERRVERDVAAAIEEVRGRPTARRH